MEKGTLSSLAIRCLRVVSLLIFVAPARGQTPTSLEDLSKLSIEELMNVEVTSVSKREQKLSRVAAAIFVITPDDIRRSGATNIPDVLRMVPGLDVAQIDGNAWQISSRGLNAQFANKLLVLIDGRTVYSPLFAGVYWDVQDVPLENIERIEVIRGPGASVWGANAVNGVINISTKTAQETQGGLVTAGGGSHEPGFGLTQYGGTFGQATSHRFFIKGSDYNSLPSLTGQDGLDGSHLLHGGFRLDSTLSNQDSLTVQGDLYGGTEGSRLNTVALTPPFGKVLALSTAVSGGNASGRWNHTFSPHSSTSLQIYFDHTNRDVVVAGDKVNTFDIDFQHHVGWGSRQDFVWGVGYRYFSYTTTPSAVLSFNPMSADRQLFTSFVQDEIMLKSDRLYLTIGAKLEHNDFSDFEFQPTARITWSLTDKHMLWAGYSRARRTPSPTERDLRISLAAFPGPGGLPSLLTLMGSPNTVSEKLDAFDSGYRTQLRPDISLDLAIFYNRYRNLRTVEPATPFMESDPLPPHLNLPTVVANQMHGETHGLEMAVNWKVTDRWKISPGYAFERIHLRLGPASHDTNSVANGEGSSPHIQAQIRSNLALSRRLEWNTSAYFVGRLPAQQVPSYTRLDSGITWRASEHLSLSLVGQNLLQDHHLEASSNSVLSSLIRRTVYAKCAWEF